MVDHFIVHAFKIKTEAAIFGGHRGAELTACARVVGGGGAMPVGRGEIPLGDVLGQCPHLPYDLDGRVNGGLYGDGIHLVQVY